MSSQWSQLPADLLVTISRKLTDISDYARFRAVCPSWRSAAAPSALPPQLPWLMLPFDVADPAVDRPFLSLSTTKIHTLHLPETGPGRTIVGSDHGWLATVDEAFVVTLSNPVTKADSITLPSLRHLAGRLTTPKYFVRRVLLSSNPTVDGCVAMALLPLHGGKFPFCRIGDERWTMVETRLSESLSYVSYHSGRFCAIAKDGNAAIINLGSSSRPKKIKSPVRYFSHNRSYGVKASEEEVIVLMYLPQWSSFDRDVHYNERKAEIFTLNLDGKLKWTRVKSIGDRTIFMSPTHSSVFHTGKFSCCKQDYIYSDRALEIRSDDEVDDDDVPDFPNIEVFDIKESTYKPEPLPGNTPELFLGGTSTWVLPSLC